MLLHSAFTKLGIKRRIRKISPDVGTVGEEMKNKKVKEEDKPICPLWSLGGSCPYCDDEWFDAGITYREAKEANRQCCKEHRQPTDEELKGYYN